LWLATISNKFFYAIPVTGYEGPWGCEALRLPHFLDNRLIDGGEVVSLMHRPPFTSTKIPKEIVWESSHWIHAAQERDHWWTSVEHGYQPVGSIQGWEFLNKLSNH
jgi:hypothetical protein